MSEPNLEAVWERLQSGRHAALVGVATPPIPGEFRPIRISCDVPPSTLGPLYDARRRLEGVLGDAPLLEQARDRVLHGLRRTLFGEAPTAEIDAVLVDLGNRLADLGGRRSILVFESVEAADPPTLAILRQMILRPGWMRLPILLIFRTREPSGPAGALLNALLRAGGFGAVVQAALGESVTTQSANQSAGALVGLGRGSLEVLRAGALIGSGFEIELCATLLDRSTLTVLLDLQAAVDHGVPLEDRGEGRIHLPAPLVVALREGITPSLAGLWHRRLAELLAPAALEREVVAGSGAESALLQAAESATPDRAIQAHAPREETTRIEGPAGERDTVIAAVPIEVLHGVPAASVPAAAQAAEVAADEVASDEVDAADDGVDEIEDTAVDEAGQAVDEAVASGVDDVVGDDVDLDVVGDLVEAADEGHGAASDGFDAATTQDLTADQLGGAPTGRPRHDDEARPSHRHRRPRGGARHVEAPAAPATPNEKSRAANDRPSARARGSYDAARAASHLHAVGESDDAALRYVEAAREAAREGLGAQALSHGRRALSILERLPPSEARRRVRITALLELAQVQWRTLGDDAHLTLETALSTARQAQGAVRPGDPPALQAEVALLIAGVAYDRGDLRALEEALGALNAASQALLAAGDSRGAASLLNDQAAIYIRLGDHVRATHLLVTSRQIFESAPADDPSAQRELAETHHLLARVPLHARVRPGREGDALSIALDHALVAEKLFRAVDDARAVARVWETMGRIEIRKGRPARAGQRLAAALEVQRSIGDAIGMARTTAALADLLAEGGQLRDSLGLLAASIGLNREKGSPLGLALNRRALAALRGKIEAPADLEVHDQVEAALEAAEELLGRFPLPQSVDDGAAS
ncbi:MAG: hypothetical protein R3B09_11780 [Nannocystaceae bacterium]